MKKTILVLLFIICVSFDLYSQGRLLSPLNNPADKELIKAGSSEMSWFMVQDTIRTKIGEIETKILKEKDSILLITTVRLNQSASDWVDSTIVDSKTFKPLYHSSFNQQRDMVLIFGDNVTGYYFEKITGNKIPILEKIDNSFFDSNFYPQLIRLLPLVNNYSTSISIFDYNPSSKTGIITATIKNTVETIINFEGIDKQVWKVECTDDISNNSAISTYYIEKSSRILLKQEIDFGGRKMVMELTN